MMKRRGNRVVFVVFAVIGLLASAGCALSTYITRLSSTPTTYLALTLAPSLTLTETATPTLTSSPTVTSTSTPTEIPTTTPTPTITPCAEFAGTVQKVQVPSSTLGVPLPVSIYLPPCYDQAGNYPVLYLLHGQGMTDQYWIDLGVVSIADKAIQNGQTPFIMVFPFEERNLEDNSKSKFPEVMINDLIPWVDDNYATCTIQIDLI